MFGLLLLYVWFLVHIKAKQIDRKPTKHLYVGHQHYPFKWSIKEVLNLRNLRQDWFVKHLLVDPHVHVTSNCQEYKVCVSNIQKEFSIRRDG